jgi:hypothetical protein
VIIRLDRDPEEPSSNLLILFALFRGHLRDFARFHSLSRIGPEANQQLSTRARIPETDEKNIFPSPNMF